jgi:spermidine synthase
MRRKSLTLAYFFLGAFALISQTMILREFFVVVYGNEFVFGILLANWLIGIFLGALFGGFVADGNKNNKKTFIISILLMSIFLPLCLTCIRLLYTISGTPAGTYISFTNVILYSALFILPISFFVGFAFPIASRIHFTEKATKRIQVHGISAIYIFEAVGSLVSGVVYTFLLVGRFNSFFTASAITVPLLIACWLILRYTKHSKLRFITLIMVIIFSIALIPFFNKKIDDYTATKRWGSFSNLPYSYSIDSKYQNIVVAHLFSQHNLYLNTMLATVFPNDHDNMLTAAHLISQHGDPRRILVIGDAISGLAKYILRYDDIKKLISVEIDPKLVSTIFKFLPQEEKQTLQQDKRLEIIIRDGRKYVKDCIIKIRKKDRQHQPFDIVYINVSEPSTLLLNRYYTEEFFQDLAKILNNNGVVALRVTASENYNKGIINDYTASIYNTLRSVFPYTAISPGTRDFIFASRNIKSISDDPELLAKRYTKKNLAPRKLGLIFKSLYPQGKTQSVKEALLNNKQYIKNRDETPVSCFYYNKIIGWYGKSSGISENLEIFETISIKDIFIILLFLFVFRLIYLLVQKKKPWIKKKALRFHILVAIFSSGMAGLSLELVILYTFQNNFGDIYYIVGFIIALFMFGLPLGACTSDSILRKKETINTSRIIKFIILAQGITASIALILPIIVTFFEAYVWINQLIIFLTTMLIGFTIGFIFPLSLYLYLSKKEKVGKTAGIVNAFDHIGAAFGAFFIGSIFLPIFGINKVCLLLALLPIMSSILFLTDIISPKPSG